MNDSLRMRLGAVLLALLTVAAVIFAFLNFQQRSRYIQSDDGVTWMDSSSGVTAWHVVADSPASKAGIKEGDIVETVRGVPIHRSTDVTKVLFRVAPWTEIRYQLRRDNRTFETPVVTAPQDNATSIDDYLRITALLYLFIGLFIFVRRWNAPRAVHFYVFCLVSFIL
jgi:two-component system, NtrC family, sensor kinase